MKVTDKIELYNCDNMELMAKYPDNYFDLAIVDRLIMLVRVMVALVGKKVSLLKYQEN